ncbi:ABC transporter permease [Ulvibacterium sp.]|uniref:ABC transporter permease n=1 Tax=Ulvibacterium sp. TaxID=2665914 RepID=UPI002631D273|nr:ABC transporter permease [Ulvibacterium sp.]
MLKQNILLFFRNIKKNKSTFMINIIGLSTGLACVLLIALWVMDELNVDKFHENHDRIYQVIEHLEFSDGIQTFMETSGPMAELLVEEMPEVEHATATIQPDWFGKHTLSVGEKNLKAVGQLVGEDYFSIFSYGWLQGDRAQAMSDPNSIVLSKKLAMNLFNTTENIIGRMVEFEKDRQFRVSGVFEGTPSNSTIQFDFALSSEASRVESPWNSLHTWNSSGPKVYVLVKEGADVAALDAKVRMIRKNRNENTIRTATLVPYSEHYLHGTYENGKQVGGRIEYVRLFSIIACIILVIACINFMNLSTARASKRLKEIGVKKAVGAKRDAFVLQFLSESVLMAFMALSLALLLVILFLPRFNTIIGKQLILDLDPGFILIMLVVTITAGLLAGSYPALYLSGFKAITVLRGKLNRSLGELWTRKGLVVVQFALSIILIVSVLVIYQQIEFTQSRNLGYERDNVVYFKLEGKVKDQLQTFMSEVEQLPGVKNAAGTTHSMIGHNWSTGLNWEGKDPNDQISFQIVGVDFDFIETMGMKMKTGRGFSREFGTDSTGIIFNETAIKAMGFENPIGKAIGPRTIIGVIEDFHFKSLHDKVEPLFLVMMPDALNKAMVRIEAGREKEAIAALQDFYGTFNPGFPFEFEFLDDNYKALYESEQRVATLSKYFAGMAILISCLGLFGLAIFTAERRRKEISIRKVLGQSATQVTVMLSSEFAKLVLVSILVALPLAYLLVKNWLSGFAYRISLDVWYFLAAGLVALGIAMLTVGSQAIGAANKNPVEGLREE